jgi:NAD(P)-dependent dehydrogenase (short-subunit alcohol dehydrogenase family)
VIEAMQTGGMQMKDFAGRIAVVTGGGTGMGRELVRQLVAEGCNVAMCDISAPAMAETKALCEGDRLPQGLRITTHVADVSDRSQVERFRDEVGDRQDTDRIQLLFNNAGIGGGGSMVAGDRDEWERTFNVCWGGVYNCARAFLPMLQKAAEGHIVNTSSINGAWASLGPGIPHTAYSAAKFAVKGLTEALITDLRINAPHIKCSVVMPGHVGTSIAANTRKIHGGTDSDLLNARQIAQARARLAAAGRDAAAMSDEDIQKIAVERERRFREEAPTSAAEAAAIILDGVKSRALAHPRRQGHRTDRRTGAPRTGTRLRYRVFRGPRARGRLAHRILTVLRQPSRTI